jgi:hypothetical protein
VSGKVRERTSFVDKEEIHQRARTTEGTREDECFG